MGGTVTERLQLIIDAKDTAKSVIRGVGAETENASVKTRLMSAAQDRLGVSSEQVGTALKGAAVAGAGLAAVGVAKWAAEGVSTVVDLTDQVRDFQRASGESAENSSRWVAALDDMEVSAETGSRAFFKLSREIGQDGGEALARFNVEVAKNKDGTTDLTGTILNIADAYKSSNDQGERAALVQAAFGKAGKELIPILEKGSGAIKELFKGAEEGHQVFSQDELNRAREFELALDDAQDNLRGFQIEAGKAILPQFTKGLEFASTAMEGADKAAGFLGTSLGDVAGTALDTLNPFHGLEAGVTELGDALGIGGDDAEDYGDKQKKVKDATTDLANAVTEHGKHSKEAADAQRDLSAATKDLKGDQDNVGDALQKVNDKLQTQAEKAYAAAQADLLAGSDRLTLEKSISAVSDAMDTYNGSALASVAASDTAGQAATRLTTNHQNLVGATLSAIAAAGKKAEDDLGPNASAADKMTASTNAQKYVLGLLEGQFPGLREQVQGYVGDLDKTAGERHGAVTLDIWQAQANLQAIESMLTRITSGVWTVEVAVVGAAKELLK